MSTLSELATFLDEQATREIDKGNSELLKDAATVVAICTATPELADKMNEAICNHNWVFGANCDSPSMARYQPFCDRCYSYMRDNPDFGKFMSQLDRNALDPK